MSQSIQVANLPAFVADGTRVGSPVVLTNIRKMLEISPRVAPPDTDATIGNFRGLYIDVGSQVPGRKCLVWSYIPREWRFTFTPVGFEISTEYEGETLYWYVHPHEICLDAHKATRFYVD